MKPTYPNSPQKNAWKSTTQLSFGLLLLPIKPRPSTFMFLSFLLIWFKV